MNEINLNLLKGILKNSSKKETDFSREDLNTALGSDDISQEGSSVLKSILQADTFQSIDSNKSKTLSTEELNSFANLDGNAATISEVDFTRLTPPAMRTEGSSKDTPEIITTPTIIQEFLDGVTHSRGPYYRPSYESSVYKKSIIGTINLNAQQNASIYVDLDGMLKILIYQSNDFKRSNTVKEYQIPISDLKQKCKSSNSEIAVTGNEIVYPQSGYASPDALKMDGDLTNAEKSKLIKIIYDNYLSNLSNLNKGATFRKASGIDNLLTQELISVSDIQAEQIQPATNINYPEIDAFMDNIPDYGIQSKSEWFQLQGNRSAYAKTYLMHNAMKNTYNYRVAITYTTNGKPVVKDISLNPNELQSIINNSCENITACNPNNTINPNNVDLNGITRFIAQQLRMDSDPIKALKARQETGEPQLAEMPSARIRSATAKDLDSALASLASEKTTHPTNAGYQTGQLPELISPNDGYSEDIKINLGNKLFGHPYNQTQLFQINHNGTNWNTVVALQDEVTSVFSWTGEDSKAYDYFASTDSVIAHLKEETGIDFSDLKPSTYKEKNPKHKQLLMDFQKYAAMLIASGGESAFLGQSPYSREGKTYLDLYSSVEQDGEGKKVSGLRNQPSTASVTR